MDKIDIKKMTKEQREELEAQLKREKDNDRKAIEREKKKYEEQRDGFVDEVFSVIDSLSRDLHEFKSSVHAKMDIHAEKLAAYGKIRSNSKGGFTLTNTEGSLRITRRRDTEPTWDERSVKAVELIKEFLVDTVKKRDQKLHEILISFLERNKNGDLEFARVMDLLKHEDKFDDPRWVEGLRLIRESYSNVLKGFGYEFKKKDAQGKWQSIILNFSSI